MATGLRTTLKSLKNVVHFLWREFKARPLGEPRELEGVLSVSQKGDRVSIVSDCDQKLAECYGALVAASFNVGLAAEFDCVQVELLPGATGAFFRKLNELGATKTNLARAKFNGERYYLIRLS